MNLAFFIFAKEAVSFERFYHQQVDRLLQPLSPFKWSWKVIKTSSCFIVAPVPAGSTRYHVLCG